MSKFPRLTLGATLLAAVGSLAGCNRSPQTASTSPSVDQTRAAQPPAMSEAEVRFGVSPTRNSEVTYQPEVLVMEHGAEAIRSQSSDGFTWTIDANAPGASQIQVDKILFATGRVVGRVLKLEHHGNDLDVTLGPVELTEVIQEAHITYHGALDPAKMIVYVAPPGYPGTFIDRDAPDPNTPNSASAMRSDRSSVMVYTVSRTGELIPLRPMAHNTHSPPCIDNVREHFSAMKTVYIASDWNDQRIGSDCIRPAEVAARNAFYVTSGGGGGSVADIAGVLLNGIHIFPDVRNGLGVSIPYKHDGMIFNAHANIRLNQPEFTFRLDISHGLKTAAVELTGVGGIEVAIEGGTSGQFKNVNQAFALPIDISFPIAGPLPFAATFHQSILVQTMFTAKQAVIRANGDYTLGGKITAGIINGKPTASAPLFIKTNQNLAYSLSGESLGVNGLVLAYGGKLIVGLGAFGLVVGPYASINTSVGITRGSDLQTATVGYTCRSGTLDLSLDYGLGFAVPSWSVKALNFALSIFHAKPISASYSTKLGTIPIKSVSDAAPPSCAAKPAE